MQKNKFEYNLLDFGLINYGKALELQNKLVEERKSDKIPDTLILLEHNDVITMGRNTKDGDLLCSEIDLEDKKIGLYRVERGGRTTYHGPGQILGYFIMKMPYNLVGNFINNIERLMIKTANDYGIHAYSRKEKMGPDGRELRGAWFSDNGLIYKIGAQGIEVKSAGNKQVITMHGFALNINTDLSKFNYIKPCGLADVQPISMARILGHEIDITDAKKRIIANFEKIFGYKII